MEYRTPTMTPTMTPSMSRSSNTRIATQKSTNARIHNREMGELDHQYKFINPINRIQIEREEFMKNSHDDPDESPSERNVDFDRRMPMRPEVSINKPHDYQPSRRQAPKDIASFNPYSEFADINADTKLSDGLQNSKSCINGINNYGFFLFDNMLNVMNSAFVFSPYLIYSIFAPLFVASSGNTEIELKNYFNYPRADILTAGIKDISSDNLKNFGNCIIFSDEIDYNPEFCKNINMMSKIRKINKSRYIKEVDEINNIIRNMSNLSKKSVGYETIKTSSVTLVNYGYVQPTWTSYFSKSVKQHDLDFIMAFGQTFGYFEQPELQVLEINSVEGLCFGIILGDIELNDKTFKLITQNLKPTILDEVKIPKFSLTTKLRYTNLLKETDLKTVFMDLNCPYLFKSECEITDCLQNIEFHVTEKSIKTEKTTGFKTTRKFIVDRSFRFYLRTSQNVIILMGSY